MRPAYVAALLCREERRVARDRREVYSPSDGDGYGVLAARYGFDRLARALVVVADRGCAGPDDALVQLVAILEHNGDVDAPAA